MSMYEKIRQPSKNHLILLLLCAVIGYLLRAQDSYVLRPVWRKRAEYHHFANKKYPTLEEQLPAPVITDLDSDGINEIVLITNDLKVSVMTLPDARGQDQEDQTLPHVNVKHKVVLPQSNGNQSEPSGWPVALATGFTTPYRSMMQVRHQVIVIVTDTWWVFCYSFSMELLWQKQLLDFGENFHNYYVKSMGAMATPDSIKKTDEGLIVVGGSYSHKAHKTEEVETSGNETDTNHSEPTENHSEPTENHSEPAEDDKYTHFSTFALSAKDGTTRWHHLPGEFGESEEKPEESIEHHWKLSMQRHRLHVGESPWTYYKQELYKSLPHHWMTVKDTKFGLGRFQKSVDDTFTDDEDDTPTPTQSALDAKHMIGYAYGGQRPHSDIEHVTNPNAVVINHQNGIEVLNLITGRPMTRLQLPADGAVYANLDQENDVKKLSWGEQENYSPCFLEVWRIFPIKDNLQRFPVCYSKRLFFTTNWVYDEDMFKKLPPIVIKSIARKSGVLRHLLGHHLQKETAEYDMIAFGSLGRIVSLDKNGDFNWQIQIAAVWADEATTIRKMKKGEWSELKEEFFTSFVPDRHLLSLQVYGPKDSVVIVGWRAISLIELTEGRILAEHSIPCTPTGPLVVGDFNNDGWNDVIFTCKYGYIGFSLHRQSNHTYTVLYGIAVFLTILVIAWMLSPETVRRYNSDDDST